MRIAGFGFRASATADSLADALAQALGYSGVRPDALAAPDDKCAAPCMQELARALKLELHAVSPSDLSDADTTTQAPRVQKIRNTGSVAEAAALCAAGPQAQLCAPRSISTDRLATCAIAEGSPK